MVDYSKTIRKFERGYDKKKSVKLSKIAHRFCDKTAVAKELKKDPVLYEVFIKDYSPMQMGLTVICPGSIGKEDYMTNGHIHTKNAPEFYILLKGSGKLILQKGKSGKSKSVKLDKGMITYIPKGFAHRLANTGRKKLKVLTIYHEDTKASYDVKFGERVFR
jgi:glucose-6-phosphate isomerase